LINFAIEGDAGGEDSQVQSLWLYQAFGGLPAKEYYEEKPILDLYTSVIAGVLSDIAKHSTHEKDATHGVDVKRDIVGSIGKAAEQGWPWPWPGDDKPDPPKPAPEPLPERMQRLAKDVVAFERDLIRAGADPEYLFNPHYAYNPYSSEKVDKALPFLHLPEYLATTGARQFPSNITVTHPPYLKAVSKLVANAPDHVLSGYFVTRLAFVHGTTLGSATGVRQELRRLQETLSGLKKGTEENRVDVCLNYVDGIVGYLAGREFVKEAFSPEAKAEGESIINGKSCSSSSII
jgi:endothelin-converting enzyme